MSRTCIIFFLFGGVDKCLFSMDVLGEMYAVITRKAYCFSNFISRQNLKARKNFQVKSERIETLSEDLWRSVTLQVYHT